MLRTTILLVLLCLPVSSAVATDFSGGCICFGTNTETNQVEDVAEYAGPASHGDAQGWCDAMDGSTRSFFGVPSGEVTTYTYECFRPTSRARAFAERVIEALESYAEEPEPRRGGRGD